MNSDTTLHLNEEIIHQSLAGGKARSESDIQEILARARQLKGLEADDVAALCAISDPGLLNELFSAARDADCPSTISLCQVRICRIKQRLTLSSRH